MHHANAGKIEYPARSPKKSLAHSPAPLCGTPRRNSARVSWAAVFIGQHCRTHDTGQQHRFILTFPRPTRAPHCAACRWQMPRSGSHCQSTRVFLYRLGYSFRRQPAPRAPPLARCSRVSGAGLALTTRAPTLRCGLRNARPSRARENGISVVHGVRSCVRPLSGARVLRTPLPPWGIPLGELAHATAQTRRRSRPPLRGARKRYYAVAPARRCSRTRQPRLRKRRRSHTWQPQGDISPFSPCGQITRKPGRRQGCYRTAKRPCP